MKAVAEDFRNQCAHLLMPGAAGKIGGNFGEVVLPPGSGHCGSVPGRNRFAKGCAGRLHRYHLGMAKARVAEQADLFVADAGETRPALGGEAVPEDFVERIRAELQATLARAQAAEALPWPDLTRTYVAELRFESIAGWLPGEEARELREAFGVEMERLYRAAGEERPKRPRL